ncbi:Conserved_hypothetical protein [Hexamita inflata]|uniref:Uncharacterized protein n=1 Tax=Hexamita inflata TaxID=28002 RepID=A0AA86QQK0_9EUKA|nr:Conserved hypothetical protein [Hexamita inflata]
MKQNNISKWTEEESQKFLKLYQTYGKDFKLITEQFPTRTYNQIRSFYYNVKKKTQNKQKQSTQSKIKSQSSQNSKKQSHDDSSSSYLEIFEVFE